MRLRDSGHFVLWPFTSGETGPSFLLAEGLRGPQSRCGRSGEERNSRSLPGIESNSSNYRSIVTPLTQVAQHRLTTGPSNLVVYRLWL